jgi:3-dehydroquinate dehydratase-2
MTIYVLHGPNLNMLEKRDASIYGGITQETIFNTLVTSFQDVDFTFYQTNHEGEMIEIIQQTNDADAFILNLGAWTHYAYAIRDALEMKSSVIVDVHLSNIYERESFRRVNILDQVSSQTFYGENIQSYIKAVEYCKTKLG